jgi:hypothetical protein
MVEIRMALVIFHEERVLVQEFRFALLQLWFLVQDLFGLEFRRTRATLLFVHSECSRGPSDHFPNTVSQNSHPIFV